MAPSEHLFDFLSGFILLLPIYKVWKLQMSTARKFAITGMFLLGSLVSIVGIVRIHFLTETYHILTKDLSAADSTCKSTHERCLDVSK